MPASQLHCVMQMDGGATGRGCYQFLAIFCVEHVDFMIRAASHFLTRCTSRPADTCVHECCQIRFQLRILIALVFIIVKAWEDVTEARFKASQAETSSVGESALNEEPFKPELLI